MPKPQEILKRLLARALKNLSKPAVKDPKILARIEYVGRCLSNRASVRLLMACMLAKLDRPEVDPANRTLKLAGRILFQVGPMMSNT